jgi:hypothetical protein
LKTTSVIDEGDEQLMRILKDNRNFVLYFGSGRFLLAKNCPSHKNSYPIFPNMPKSIFCFSTIHI